MAIASSTIAQQAFAELALRPISSYGDDTPEAVEAASAITRARDLVLSSYDWSFARRLVTLSALSAEDVAKLSAADPRLPFVFNLPAETRALRGVFALDDPLRRLDWRREGALVRASEAAAAALISRSIEREDDLPPAVQYAIALQMAALMAPRYAPTRAKSDDIENRLLQALRRARQDDTQSGAPHRLDGLDPSYGDDWAAQVTR